MNLHDCDVAELFEGMPGNFFEGQMSEPPGRFTDQSQVNSTIYNLNI